MYKPPCVRPYPLLYARIIDIEQKMPPEPCLFEFYVHICSLDEDRMNNRLERQFMAHDYILHGNEVPVIASFVFWEIDHPCCSLHLTAYQSKALPYRVIGRYRATTGNIQCFSIRRATQEEAASLAQYKGNRMLLR